MKVDESGQGLVSYGMFLVLAVVGAIVAYGAAYRLGYFEWYCCLVPFIIAGVNSAWLRLRS